MTVTFFDRYRRGRSGSSLLSRSVHGAIAALKYALPPAAARRLRQWKRAALARRTLRQWDAACRQLTVETHRDRVRSLLIFPSDPGGIVGAVGDDAMITAAVDHYRALVPDAGVSVLCAAGPAEEIVRSRGFLPVVLPRMADFPTGMAEIVGSGRYDGLVALGADVMDGFYAPATSARIVIAADLAARAGMQSVILGFSFNAAPAPELAPHFARLDGRVAVNLRDEVSLERFRRFAPARGRLVADCAFALPPGAVGAETLHWIATQREAGRRVIGINLHPMLVSDPTTGEVERMVRRMAAAITGVGPAVSWLLIPHDYRDDSGDGDGLCLQPLQARLAQISGLRARLFEGRHPAGTLKALAGQLDGVVTGRMHLAIAALGMGVPVLCLTYQDKFEGLMQHFGLPSDLLLPPEVLERAGNLDAALAQFIESLDGLAARIDIARPHVLALAARNFDPVGSAPA